MEFLLDLGRKFRDRVFDFPFFFVNNCDGTRIIIGEISFGLI